MSDSTRKIRITSDNDEGQEEASENVADVDYDDDEEKKREPINLDFQGGLADALAAATRIRKPAAEASSRAAASYAANDGNGRAEAQSSSSVVIDAVTTAEPSTEAPAEARVSDSVVNAELERLRSEAKQANENYLRALADLQNFRRRGEEERSRILKDGNEKLIKEFLPVLDDFDLAVSHAKQVESYEQLIGGVEAILRKVRETLSKAGVEATEAVGEKFDPDMHEAVMVDEDSDQPDETVTSELRKGYTLHKRVIRPSLVKVAKS